MRDTTSQPASLEAETEAEASAPSPPLSSQPAPNTTGTTSNPIRLLLINPNSTTSMTDALKPVVASLKMPHVQTTFFTAPTPSPPSINSPADGLKSAEVCLPLLRPLIARDDNNDNNDNDNEDKDGDGPEYDAFLVACYSAHPLVPMLRKEIRKRDLGLGPGPGGARSGNQRRTRKQYVTGIFEASVLTCLGVVANAGYGEGEAEGEADETENETETETETTASKGKDNENETANANESWGIVSTSPLMGAAIHRAVERFLGPASANNQNSAGPRNPIRGFRGVTTTGLTASELHSLPAHVVREKMRDATRRLILLLGDDGEKAKEQEQKAWPLGAICLGCAGMVGLEGAVRQACVETYGPERGAAVRIVDGVKAGVGLLVGWVAGGM